MKVEHIGDATLYLGDVTDALRLLPAESVQTVVTSPPYWGLRDYGVDGQIGLEDTPGEYVEKMVAVFADVRRVLRDDGTVWINLGDLYSNGMSNLTDCMHRQLESGVLFVGGVDPRRCTSERVHILLYDKGSPDTEFEPLFSAQRICIKNGEDDFCEVGGQLDAPIACWVSASFGFARPKNTDSKCVMDIPENAGIIIATTKLDANSPFRIFPAVSVKDSKAAFAVEISREPKTKRVSGTIARLDTVTLNAGLKCASEINAVDESIAFLERANLDSGLTRDFTVRKATDQQITFGLHCGIDMRIECVRHCSLLSDGIIPYILLLVEATARRNEMQAKQEMGMPGLVKRALMRDGWICRQTIIWSKPNPMPESVTDRCTKAHENIFLLSKSARYYYDAEAIKEPASPDTHARYARGRSDTHKWADGGPGDQTIAKTFEHMRKPGVYPKAAPAGSGIKANESFSAAIKDIVGTRNKRSVWTVATAPYCAGHFATFPPKLIEPCILAGSRPGDTVLDPFGGSGTTAGVALKHGRKAILCEVSKEYAALVPERIRSITDAIDQPRLFENEDLTPVDQHELF